MIELDSLVQVADTFNREIDSKDVNCAVMVIEIYADGRTAAIDEVTWYIVSHIMRS